MSAPALTYVTDDPAKVYAADIDAASDVESLRQVLTDWAGYAPDALLTASRMTDADWPAFKTGLESERRGQVAGEAWADRWIDILLPGDMLDATMLASKLTVPWGCALIRLREIREDEK